MEAKRIADSRVTLSHLMGPQDANTLGNVHGGVLMKLVDEAAALCAMRHSEHIVVTVAIDSMTFRKPILIGSVVTIHAELTYVGRTSMEVRIQVIAENPISREGGHTNSGYLVFVAIDSDHKPCEVPPLKLESDAEKDRWKQAEDRQAFRKQQQYNEEALKDG